VTKEQYHKALHDALDFCINIGKTCFPPSARIEQDNAPTVIKTMYCTSLLIRAMHKAHAINLLLNESMPDEARIMLRVLLETSFSVGAIVKRDDFSEKYVNDSKRQNLRYLKNLREATKYPETMYKIDGPIDELIETLTKEVKGTEKIDVYDYAEQAGVLPLYYGPYSILCSSVHSGSSDIDSYIRKDVDGKAFHVGKPDEKDPDLIYFTAMESMKNILNWYATLT